MISETISVLSVLAAVTNDAHEKTNRRSSEETLHAIRAGDALLAVSAILPDSKFDAWVKAFCHFNHRQADSYMSIAKSAGGFLPLLSSVTTPE
ncbi:hypothetical protein [Rhizobium oryzihabitans]|uniref:hypothetical protein n=1 Tax=Rhizobium oryzihabitans TaxID=2267833 RepID=UPI004036E52B